MERRRLLLMNVAILAIALGMAGASKSAPMGTAFTYQGRLNDANSPADGLHDFEFELYDQNTGSNQFGNTLSKDDVDVIDGYFAVPLDFGSEPNIFDGNARWLEVSVRPGESSDPCDFATLSPRQEITPTPYVLYSKETRGIFVDGIGNVGIGDENPSDKLDVEGHIDSTETYKLGGNTVLSNEGNFNIFVGQGAGAFNATGQHNSAVGYLALQSNTDGQGNSAMGSNALKSNTTGERNTAMGNYALSLNDTGYNNTGLGSFALQNNTTGILNSAVGCFALGSNTTGNYNSAMGTSALFVNTIGNYNTAVGYGALLENNEGNGNSAVGHKAIRSNLTGGSNSALGDSALYSNTTGFHNSAMGYRALYSNTTGNYNTGIGNYANYYNNEGSRNTMLGYSAGQGTAAHNKSGNVFIGYQAGYNETGSDKLYIANSEVNPPLIYGDFSTGQLGIGTTSPLEKLDVDGHINSTETYKLGGSTVLSNTGGFNIFVGKNAGYSTTIGQQNSALGYYALNNNTEGHFNSAIGYRSLNLNTTGNNNSALGAQALGSNTIGEHNSAVGYSALFSNTEGNYNSAVGCNALRSNTTGLDNSALGYQAGYNNSTGSRNVFLGYKAGYNETGSDKLYIANSEVNPPLIYGDFSTGNLGIGTTTPARKLHINDVMRLEPRSTAPSSPSEGDIYYNSTMHQLMYYNGTTWVAL